MAEVPDSGNSSLRRWAPSRIASALVLVIVILGGAAYGIYTLTSSSPSKPSVSSQSPKEQSTKSPNSGTNNSSSGSNPGSSNSTPSTNQGNSSGSLTNTGPGDTALISFIAFSAIGTVTHYALRKLRSSNN